VIVRLAPAKKMFLFLLWRRKWNDFPPFLHFLISSIGAHYFRRQLLSLLLFPGKEMSPMKKKENGGKNEDPN
jgi:hypothetical protein